MIEKNLIVTALSIITFFIMYLMSNEFREKFIYLKKCKKESFLILILFISVFYLGGERNDGDEFINATRYVRIISYLSIGFFSTLFIIKEISNFNNKFLILFFVYIVSCFMTSLYSFDIYLTLWKSFELYTHFVVFCLIAIKLDNLRSVFDLYSYIYILLVFILITLICGLILYYDDALRPFLNNKGEIANDGLLGRGLRGVYPRLHLNSVTQLCAIIGAISLINFNYSKNKSFHFFILFLSLAAMLSAHSRTSIVAFSIFYFISFFYIKKTNYRIVFVLLVFLSLTYIFTDTIIQDYILRGQTTNQVTNMNGRIEMWSKVTDVLNENPLFGFGYYAGTRYIFNLPGVDNTYLNVMMGGGFFLLIIFLLPLLYLTIYIFKSRINKRKLDKNILYKNIWLQAVSLYILLLMRSITGPSFDSNHFNLILYLLIGSTIKTIFLHKKYIQRYD